MSIQSRKLNPFPGLRPFTQEEDYLFFGREEQTIELLQRLSRNRFVAVVGTSGSGKSSLVRCGLLSELLGGKMLQAGASWEIAVTHPGGNPLALLTEALLEADLYDRDEEHARENLLATLSRSHFGLVEAVRQAGLGEDTNFLLVVDQFEEIFRFREAGQTQQEAANEFVSILLEAVAHADVPIYVVLTMRSDFIGECGQFEGLAEMVNRGEFLIPRLNREQFKRVIEGPIKVAGGQITPRLMQRLLNDLGQQADQLPCLQHALMRTWNIWAEKGDAEALDLDDYQRVGKMTQALSLHADEVYRSLESDRQREMCRGLFQALTVQESENRGIRRPQRLGSLCQILETTTDELLPIIDAYRQPGVTFLVPSWDVELSDRTIIDISHESLMRVWTRLRHWVDEEAQAVGVFLRLSESAALYEKGKAGLYRDPELGIALAWRDTRQPNEAWAARYHPGFASGMEYLEASQQASLAEDEAREDVRRRELKQAQKLAEAERQRAEIQHRSARRLRVMVAGFAVVAIFAIVASVVAYRAKRDADRANAVAQKSAKAAQVSADDAEKSADDAKREAQGATAKEAEAVAAQAALQEQKFSTDMTLAQHAYDSGNVSDVSERLLEHIPAAGEPDRRGIEWRLWWNASHQEQQVVNRGGSHIFAVAISPDGKLVADSHWYTNIRLRELANPRKVKSFTLNGAGEIHWLRFSPDSSMLAAVARDNRIHRFRTEGAASLGSVRAPAPLRGLAFSPTQDVIVSGGGDGRLYFWDTNSWERSDSPASTDSLPIWSVAYSPDGGHLVAGTDGAGGALYARLGVDSPLILWDTAANSIRKTGHGHTARITSIAWSPDGQLIASGSADETVRVWTKDLSPVDTLSSLAWVTAVAFSPDGKYLAAGTGKDNAIRVWSTESWELATTLKGHSKPVTAITFDPCRGDLWSVSGDSTIKTWNIERSLGQPVNAFREESLRTMLTSINGAMVASDGRSLFGGRGYGPIERFDLESHTELPPWNGGKHYQHVAASDDVSVLAAIDEDNGLVQAWRLDSEEQIAEVQIPAEDVSTLHTLGVSRGAKIIAWAAGDPLYLVLVDTESGNRHQAPLRLGGPDNWKSMTISPDGKQLSVKDGFTVRVLDVVGFAAGSAPEPASKNVGNIGLSHSFAFSSDGKLGASAQFDSVIHVQDLETGQRLHTLTGHSSEVYCAAFSRDGRRLLSCSQDGTVKIWDVTTGDLLTTLRGHSGPVNWVGFRKDDSEIISISHADGTVRIWRAAAFDALEQNPLYWEQLAERHRQAGRQEQALAAYDQAIQRSPNDANLFLARANLYSELAHSEAAVRDYISLLALGAANAEILSQARALTDLTPVAANSQQRRLSWRYTLRQPDDDWTEPGFDDDAWEVGIAPFGTYTNDATQWEDADIWLRCELEVTEPVSRPLSFLAYCDDKAEFYLNGHLAATGTFVGERSQAIPCSVRAAASLEPGRNVLAVHCQNTGGNGRIDANVVVDQGLQRWIDLLTAALDENPENIHLLQARLQAQQEQGDADSAAAAKLLSLLRSAAEAELENPDIAWPTYANLLADQLLMTFQTEKSENWQVLDAVEMKSAGGATLTKLPDGSILASGANPNSDTYTIVAETDLTSIDALRIEALTDPSLPRGGPGRDSKRDIGNFGIIGLNIISASPAQPDETSPVRFDKAWADYDNRQSEGLLMGHWNTGGRGGQPHQAIFRLEQPIRHEKGIRLIFTIPFQTNEEYPGQNLGRFRLSVADDADVWQETMVANQLQNLPGEWAKLVAAYQLVGDTEASDQLLEHKPQAAVGIGDLYAAAEQWERAVAFFNRQISADTTDASLFAKRGEAYAALEQGDEAKADWHRAAELRDNALEEPFDRLRLASKWKQAAQVGVLLIEQDPGDRMRWLRVAPILVLAKDKQGYQKFCDRMVKQFRDTTDQTVAESTCKSCLLLPGAVDLARLPLQPFTEPLDKGTAPGWFRPWGCAARSRLVAYRSGDADSAATYLQEASSSQPAVATRALISSIEALNRLKQGNLSGAREALESTSKLIDEHLPSAPAGQLHDWLIPLIIAREAEMLLSDEGEASERASSPE